MALAKGARSGGVQFFEDTKVTAINHSDGRVTGVETEAGVIDAPFVVLAAGMWSRDIAATLGVNVPLHPGAVKYYKEIGFKIPARLIP